MTVLGHTDLGGAGLNGHMATLDDYVFVGSGTNGGFAAQWDKTPTCRTSSSPVNTVKVVDAHNAANPTVVATINVDTPGQPGKTLPRDVAATTVAAISPDNVFTGRLLAVGMERCNNLANQGQAGIALYDVNNPANPVFLGKTVRYDPPNNRFSAGVRQVNVVQRADGRVFAMEANQQGGLFGGGVQLVDITNPANPVDVGIHKINNTVASPIQECRPFSIAQGVSMNDAGNQAYISYQDEGLFVVDISSPPGAGNPLPVVGHTKYASNEEGNTFRFVPRGDEADVAAVTDDDILPSRFQLSIAAGSSAASVTEPGGTAPGVFRGCEAIFGAGAPTTGPLYKRSNPSITAEIKFIPANGCDPSAYAGIDVVGKIALTDRGGVLANGTICGFDHKAQFAQAAGASAILIGNTLLDHHGGAAGFLFSPDSNFVGDAGISIPMAMITRESRTAIRSSVVAGQTVNATIAATPQTWGALRIFDTTGANPVQTSVFNAPHTGVLTPGDGLYHAVNPTWRGNQALVAWMSDGLRVVDVQNPSSPQPRAWYVPPASADPTGNYGTVPLVVDVEKLRGNIYVASDINGGLYVLKVAFKLDDCGSQAHPVACQAAMAATAVPPAPQTGPLSSSTVVTNNDLEVTTE